MSNPYQNVWGSVKIGEGTRIAAFVDIGDGVEIGKNCTIQCFVSIPPGWKIGNDVFIGPHVSFANDRHPKANGEWEIQSGEVKDGASIGMGARILPVVIGKNSMVGAGAVVTKDIPDGETWAGVPANPIKK
jgi:UDP-2-acetamido-3-amino-2,3-dideoxy-glucuronate N-acetyltransferase